MEHERPLISLGPLPRCPYCHDEVSPGAEKEACPGCMAWHHLACWHEHGTRCASCGQGRTGPSDREQEPARAARDLVAGVVFSGFLFGGVIAGAIIGAKYFNGPAPIALALLLGLAGGWIGLCLAPGGRRRAGRAPRPPKGP